MNKLTQLRQLIREELMKEIAVGNMARGNQYGESEALLKAVMELGFDKDELGRPEFDNKHKVIYFPESDMDIFAAWTKPSTSITIDGQTLNNTKWEEHKTEQGKLGLFSNKPFFIYNED